MFVDALIHVCPNIFIMRPREGEVNPHRLVADCEQCFAPQDAAERTLANLSDVFSSSSENGQSPEATTVQ